MHFIIIDKESFNKVPSWISFAKDIEDSLIVIVGNKTDLERKVSTEEGQAVATNLGALFYEISTKLNDGVFNMLFHSISHLSFFNKLKISKNQLVKELEQENGVSLDDAPNHNPLPPVKNGCKC